MLLINTETSRLGSTIKGGYMRKTMILVRLFLSLGAIALAVSVYIHTKKEQAKEELRFAQWLSFSYRLNSCSKSEMPEGPLHISYLGANGGVTASGCDEKVGTVGENWLTAHYGPHGQISFYAEPNPYPFTRKAIIVTGTRTLNVEQEGVPILKFRR